MAKNLLTVMAILLAVTVLACGCSPVGNVPTEGSSGTDGSTVAVEEEASSSAAGNTQEATEENGRNEVETQGNPPETKPDMPVGGTVPPGETQPNTTAPTQPPTQLPTEPATAPEETQTEAQDGEMTDDPGGIIF